MIMRFGGCTQAATAESVRYLKMQPHCASAFLPQRHTHSTRIVVLFILLGTALQVAAQKTQEPSTGAELDRARDAYFQGAVANAVGAFSRIAHDEQFDNQSRAEAYAELGHIDWQIYERSSDAIEDLATAIALRGSLCPYAALETRILRESRHISQALKTAATAEATCGVEEAYKVRLEDARTEMAIARDSDTRLRIKALGSAERDLNGAGILSEIDPQAQSIYLEVALLRRDPKEALSAWRGFFWLTSSNLPSGIVADDSHLPTIFKNALDVHSSASGRIALLRLLIRGGFYEQAKAFDSMQADWRKVRRSGPYQPIKTYYALRERLTTSILSFNRQVAQGSGDAKSFHAEMVDAHMTAAHVFDKAANDWKAILQREYGLFGTLGLTAGYESLHEGHIAQDETLLVEQGARHGQVHFVVLDNMISNGYQSWLWDGSASTGGWGSDALIVQVRSSYTGSALKALALLQSPEDTEAATQPKLDAQDRTTVQRTAVAYLPGVEKRLKLQVAEEIASDARAEASASGEPFPRVFVRKYWDAQVDQSIKAHEGRHALDAVDPIMAHASSAELEFRAKLSELEYSSYPMLALANILSPDIGGQTPHGLADTRLISLLVDWMRTQQANILGYQREEEPLLQLSLLSNEHLRMFARTMDNISQPPELSQAPQNALEIASGPAR